MSLLKFYDRIDWVARKENGRKYIYINALTGSYAKTPTATYAKKVIYVTLYLPIVWIE